MSNKVLMKNSSPHRGANGDMAIFAKRFVEGRLAGFEKDMNICLTPVRSETRPGNTHAYFPALAACCGILEYLAALHSGNTKNALGWKKVADWAEIFLPQPDYNRETIRILVEAFRHPVAHRGIASGVWVDPKPGAGNGRRLTWKISADAKRPACKVIAESGQLTRDPPWPCPYSHRVHIHLRGVLVDIRNAANLYSDHLISNPKLLSKFETCMKQLYPT